jgi:hypothetical protein
MVREMNRPEFGLSLVSLIPGWKKERRGKRGEEREERKERRGKRGEEREERKERRGNPFNRLTLTRKTKIAQIFLIFYVSDLF